MVLYVLRALFIFIMAAIGWSFVIRKEQIFGDYTWLSMAITISIAILLVAIDTVSPRKKLQVFAGTFLGLLVGMAVAYALSFAVDFLADQFLSRADLGLRNLEVARQRYQAIVFFTKLVVGVGCCYLAISFILQTKDDFRFIIPYVQFSRQLRGARPILVDTSVIIDGRIQDIASTGILESRLIVPRFVLQELQTVADSGDKLKRNRGRRGLDVLKALQSNNKAEVIIYDTAANEEQGVDARLMELAKELSARVLTNDFNLCKIAQLQNVDVININDLANALKPIVLPGEKMRVKVVKAGEEASQGVGYLEDGTMVVVENGRAHIGTEIELMVTSVLQTSAGRMIFGRFSEAAQRKPKPTPAAAE